MKLSAVKVRSFIHWAQQKGNGKKKLILVHTYHLYRRQITNLELFKNYCCYCLYCVYFIQIRSTDPKIHTGLVWEKEAGSFILLGMKVSEKTLVFSRIIGSILDKMWTYSLPWVFYLLGISYFIADKDHVSR